MSGWCSRYSDSQRAGRSAVRLPVGARFDVPVQNGPVAHLASCTVGVGLSPGVKRTMRDVDHQTPSSAEVKEKSMNIPVLQLWVFMACSRVIFAVLFVKTHYYNTYSLYNKPLRFALLQYL